jgi:hypothetical protein
MGVLYLFGWSNGSTLAESRARPPDGATVPFNAKRNRCDAFRSHRSTGRGHCRGWAEVKGGVSNAQCWVKWGDVSGAYRARA